MSYQIIIKERKNDGWYYDDEVKERGFSVGIYETDLIIWRNALDTLFSDSTLSKAFNEAKTIAEKKKIIWMAMQICLGFQMNDLKTDLETSIKIYPFPIKRGRTKRAGE